MAEKHFAGLFEDLFALVERKEKSVVLVMDEDKFSSQMDEIYDLRKSSIHVYEGDMIERLRYLEEENERLKKVIEEA